MPTLKPLPSRLSRRIALSALAAAAVTVVLSGCGEQSAKPAATSSSNVRPSTPPEGLAVTVISASKKDIPASLLVDAELVSLSSPSLASEVSAKVLRVLAQPGQQVRQGQLLVELDGADLYLSAEESRYQVAQLQAHLAEKTRAWSRAEELYAKEYVSRSSRDAARAELDVAQAQVSAAQARTQLSQRALGKSRVVAPFDGTVLDVRTAPGAFARAGDILLQLWSPSVSTLRVRVPQEELGKVQPGQRVSLQWENRTLVSKVARVNTAINSGSRSFEAQVEVPPELAAISGLSLRARIELASRDRLVVPAQAPQLEGAQAYLVLFQEGKAHRVAVELGEQQGGFVEIRSGLKEGAQVVVEGASFASEGQALQVKEAPL